jgi:hypothetical protein
VALVPTLVTLNTYGPPDALSADVFPADVLSVGVPPPLETVLGAVLETALEAVPAVLPQAANINTNVNPSSIIIAAAEIKVNFLFMVVSSFLNVQK